MAKGNARRTVTGVVGLPLVVRNELQRIVLMEVLRVLVHKLCKTTRRE